jgi:hypothetical protein
VRPFRHRLPAVLVTAAIVTAGCGGQVLSVEVGDCFQDPEGGEAEVVDVETVDCDEPHDNEVFHVFELPEGDFPGEDAIAEAFVAECVDQRFEAFVGTPYLESEVDAFPLAPTEGSWDRADDREVICAAYVPGERVEGSLQDSGR